MGHGALGMGRQGRQGEKSPASAWGVHRRGYRRHQNFGETRRINPDFTVTIPNAQCPTPNAQCPMPNAQCPMPNAQCRIFY
ncbi:hypothetical protein [Nostoc linckia]|uniref:hypothetical protein n=1 Tax=Nostoc linckia TaxID=92942 RepID=UPI0015D4EDF2|nr:hypothetical protein [Nostoc linckia]